MNRREAVLTGVGAATALHDRLGIRNALRSGSSPIDVLGVIEQLGIPLLFRPLMGLLGLYLPPPAGPGIMVTTQRSLHMQRFTAAHELGHYILSHTNSSFDDRIGFVSRGNYDQDLLQEVAADAFAAEFMLPRWLLISHIRRRGWEPEDLRKPEIIYQLSLRLGMSYQATCFSLAGHDMLRQAEMDALLSVSPKTSKQKALGNVKPESWNFDVWDLSIADGGSQILGGPDDIVVITLEEHVAGGYTWDMSVAEKNGISVLDDRRDTERGGNLGAVISRRVVLSGSISGFIKFQESREWSDDAPLNSMSLDMYMRGREFLPLVADQLAA